MDFLRLRWKFNVIADFSFNKISQIIEQHYFNTHPKIVSNESFPLSTYHSPNKMAQLWINKAQIDFLPKHFHHFPSSQSSIDKFIWLYFSSHNFSITTTANSIHTPQNIFFIRLAYNKITFECFFIAIIW